MCLSHLLPPSLNSSALTTVLEFPCSHGLTRPPCHPCSGFRCLRCPRCPQEIKGWERDNALSQILQGQQHLHQRQWEVKVERDDGRKLGRRWMMENLSSISPPNHPPLSLSSFFLYFLKLGDSELGGRSGITNRNNAFLNTATKWILYDLLSLDWCSLMRLN